MQKFGPHTPCFEKGYSWSCNFPPFPVTSIACVSLCHIPKFDHVFSARCRPIHRMVGLSCVCSRSWWTKACWEWIARGEGTLRWIEHWLLLPWDSCVEFLPTTDFLVLRVRDSVMPDLCSHPLLVNAAIRLTWDTQAQVTSLCNHNCSTIVKVWCKIQQKCKVHKKKMNQGLGGVRSKIRQRFWHIF